MTRHWFELTDFERRGWIDRWKRWIRALQAAEQSKLRHPSNQN